MLAIPMRTSLIVRTQGRKYRVWVYQGVPYAASLHAVIGQAGQIYRRDATGWEGEPRLNDTVRGLLNEAVAEIKTGTVR